MSSFGGVFLTNRGRNLQVKAQTGAVLRFTRIAIGDGQLNGSLPNDLTALKSEKKSIAITKLKTQPGGQAIVGGIITNSGITSGFYFREIGLFANDPDLGEILYGYANAGNTAEYISADNGADLIEKSLDIVTVVGNAPNVSAVINQSLVFATKDLATTTIEGLMSAEDKTKLNGIESGANKYTHPANHPPSIITQDSNNRFVTDAEKTAWNGKASTSVATTTTNGLMPSADKSKLDNATSAATASRLMIRDANGRAKVAAPSADDDIALLGTVKTLIANLVNSAPATLDTLDELAQALGDDPNFATTILNRITQGEQNLSTHLLDNLIHVTQQEKNLWNKVFTRGTNTEATGSDANAEGKSTSAIGSAAHAEGENTIAHSDYSHSEGRYSLAIYSTAIASITAFDNTAKTVTVDNTNGFAVNNIVTIYFNNAKSVDATITAVDLANNKITLNTSAILNSSAKRLLKKATSSVYPTHAEGQGTLSAGQGSHTEGMQTIAIGSAAHAEGNLSTASANFSHAEGNQTAALGIGSHAEGTNTTAGSDYSHAEGFNSVAQQSTLTANITAYDNVGKTLTLDNITGLVINSIVMIPFTDKKAIEVPISAIDTTNKVITITTTLTIDSTWKFLLLKSTDVYASSSHAEGYGTISSGMSSHSEGSFTVASGFYSHAEGNGTVASGHTSHAEGSYTIASGNFSHAEGQYTSTNSRAHAHIMGAFGDATDAKSWHLANGTGNSSKGLAAKITSNGVAYSDGAWNSTGADYAEMFEWADSNPGNADRVGFFVTFDEIQPDKIRIATDSDDNVLGVVSASPTVIGDNSELNWKGRWLLDEWGRKQFKEVHVPAITEVVNGKTIEIVPERVEIQPIVNPEWNPEEFYIPREKRPEWSPIGLMGKLRIRDDGSCVAGSYCKPNENGIATKSDNGYYVMKRTGKNQVLVMLR